MARKVWVVAPGQEIDDTVIDAAWSVGAPEIVQGVPRSLRPFVDDPPPAFPFLVEEPDPDELPAPPVPPPDPVPEVAPDPDEVRLEELASKAEGDGLTADEQGEAVALMLKRIT